MSADSPSTGEPLEAPRASAIETRASVALPSEGRASRAARYGAFAFGAVVLGVLGSWTHHAIEGELKDMRAASLASVLDAEVQALEVWIAEKKLAARRLARDARLRERVGALVARAQGTPCTSLEAAGLREPLDAFLQDETVAEFHVLDARGRTIAARPQSACRGLPADAPLGRALGLALAGETPFVRPARERDGSPSVLWFLTPVADADGRPIAALALGKFTEGRFATILSAAHAGGKGEVYAFDERARMLTESRFAPASRASDPVVAT